jgi:hypothetical protein
MDLLIASDEEVQVGDFKLESTLLKTESMAAEQVTQQDNSAVKTKRLAQQSRFWLKEAMAQRGDSAAFLHWLSSDGGKHA